MSQGFIQTERTLVLTQSYVLVGGADTQFLFNNSGSVTGTGALTYVSGQLYATGNFTGSFTGFLYGTSSWALNSITSSYSLNSNTSSYALTASYINLIAGPNIYIQYTGSGIIISASTDTPSIIGGNDTYIQFNSGSNFSGSNNFTFNYTNNIVSLTGSLYATSITSSLYGTASWALSASNTISSSYSISASQAISSSYAISASYAISSSQSDSSSYAISSSQSISSSYAISASRSISSSYAISSSQSISASFASTSSYTISSSYSLSSSYSNLATSASLIEISNLTSSNIYYPIFVDSISGYKQLHVNNVSFIYNSAINLLTVTSSFSLTSSYIPIIQGPGIYATYISGALYLSASVTSSGTVVSASGNNYQIQYNSGSTFNASPNFIFDYLNNTVKITGSLIVSNGITGNLTGTASQAITASYVKSASYAQISDTSISSSYAISASGAISASQAITASYTNFALSSSYSNNSSTASFATGGSGSFTGSFFGTSSWSVTASYAITASYVTTSYLNITGGGLVGQIQYKSGSDGSLNGVPVLTYISGNLSGTGSFSGSFVGNLTGTASYANTASYTLSSSYAISSSYASVSQQSVSSSYSISASQAITASYVLSASYATSASQAITASYSISSISSSYATSASQAITASYVATASYAISSSQAITASYTISSSYATSASYAISSSQALTASFVITASTLSDNIWSRSTGISSSILTNSDNTASGLFSLAHGKGTVAYNSYSLSQGGYTNAASEGSHAEGFGTLTAIGSVGTTGSFVQYDISGYSIQPWDYYGDNSVWVLSAVGDQVNNAPNLIYNQSWFSIIQQNGSVTALVYDNTFSSFGFATIDTIVYDSILNRTFFYDSAISGISLLSGIVTDLTNIDITGVSYTIPSQAAISTDPVAPYSHAEGKFTKTTAPFSHAEGELSIASATGSHAEGLNTITVGDYSHAEGSNTTASGQFSHAEGSSSRALGVASHAEGYHTIAIGESSRASGMETVAFGSFSNTEGLGTIASGAFQSVLGTYNKLNNNSALFIIGNGRDQNTRSDLALFYNDNIIFSSSLEVLFGITASMFGTASYAISASQAVTSSYSNTSISASYAITAAFALNATSGTGSTNPGGSNKNIQYNSSSTFAGTNNFTFDPTSNRVSLTGSLFATSITGSLYGTSSWALNSITSSYTVSSSYATSASQALTASYTLSSSYSISASQAISASYAKTASYIPSGSLPILAGPNIIINYQPNGIAISASNAVVGNVNSIDTFWNLATTTTYTDYLVRGFDTGVTNGGGYFKYFSGNNNGIVNIPGIIIKSANGQNNGYWQRVYSGPLNVDWFGSTNSNQTIATVTGISQATADSRYGSGFCNVNTDTCDWLSINLMFRLMETSSYQTVEFNPKTYYVNRTSNLPRFVFGVGESLFEISGRTATISALNGNFDIFSRVPADQTTALNGSGGSPSYIGSKFRINGFKIIGKGSQFSGQTGIRLGPSYGSIIEFMSFQYLDVCLELEFCLNATVQFCTAIGLNYSYKAAVGRWTGASGPSSNAQSNHTTFYHCTATRQNSDGLGNSITLGTAGFFIQGSSGVKISDCIVEGFPQNYGAIWDRMGSPNAKDFTIENTHVETSCGKAAFYLSGAGDGIFNISKIYNQYPNTLVEVLEDSAALIKISNISDTVESNNGLYACRTVVDQPAGTATYWKFEDCYKGTRPWQLSAQNSARTFTGNIATANPTVISGISSTSGIQVGWKIRGTTNSIFAEKSLDGDTTVIQVNANSIVLSKPAILQSYYGAGTYNGLKFWTQDPTADKKHPYNPFAWKTGSAGNPENYRIPRLYRDTDLTKEIGNPWRCYVIDPLNIESGDSSNPDINYH